MSRIASLAPAAVVAASCALVLWATPRIAQRTVDERAALQAEQSRQVLGRRNVLAEISEAQRELAQVVEPSVVLVESVLDGRGGQRTGSGWVYDADGHVVTNAHVVDGAGTVTVQTSSGAVLTAEIVGLDLRTDIAVLQASGDGLVAAERSQRTPLQGELVFAFGSPFDFRFSMSAGIVSGIGRTAGLSSIDYENFIQVDAAINPGNSGGPLCDVYGRVIGMNTAIATGRGAMLGQGQFGGIGLAIPMEIIESVVGQILEQGTVEQGYLGVSTASLRELQQQFARARARDPRHRAVRARWPGRDGRQCRRGGRARWGRSGRRDPGDQRTVGGDDGRAHEPDRHATAGGVGPVAPVGTSFR